MNKYQKMALLNKDGIVLDIGFAQTPNKYLRGKVIGVDVQHVKKLPKNYQKAIKVNLNTQTLPFASNTIDSINMGEIIEHVENPSAALREINRVLKKDGKFIMSAPHANDWWTTTHNWFTPFIRDQDPGEHLSNWSKIDMVRLLKVNGFKVKKIHGTTVRIPLVPMLQIPVGPLHMLSWILIYECEKQGKPKQYILTKNTVGKILKET